MARTLLTAKEGTTHDQRPTTHAISGPPPHNLRYLPDLPRLAHKCVFGRDWPSPPIAQTTAGILALGLTQPQLTAPFRDMAAELLRLGLPRVE